VRKGLLRFLAPAVIPVVLLGLSAGVTSASASTVHAVSPAPAAHSSIMRIAATSHLATRFQMTEAGREASSRTATGITRATDYIGQWCFEAGGGPWACLGTDPFDEWVFVDTNGPGDVVDDNFDVHQESDGYWYIQSQKITVGGGECVGDAYNKSGYADTSLDPCGTGWGTNFIAYIGTSSGVCPNNSSIAFYNTHWKGWLGPPSNWSRGSEFYLNKSTPYCFGWYQ
jgi:hypothetical protein